jgi:hypothetical protein
MLAAMSSGSPIHPVGALPQNRNPLSRALDSRPPVTIGVRTVPGATAFTLMPFDASSAAKTRVSCTSSQLGCRIAVKPHLRLFGRRGRDNNDLTPPCIAYLTLIVARQPDLGWKGYRVGGGEPPRFRLTGAEALQDLEGCASADGPDRSSVPAGFCRCASSACCA